MPPKKNPARPNVSSEAIIRLIKNLLRYDIPVFELGRSSIGKSFTIIELAEKFRVDYSMLYVGSEKGENIEGVPKLTGVQGVDVLSYLKPYWYPREISSGAATGIIDNMRKGKEIYFNKYIANNIPEKRRASAKYYDVLNDCLERVSRVEFTTLQTEAAIGDVKYTREEVKALGMFVSTCLGYGNFWLVLDEIDKVEETDVDKYAPLLHIVRERRLKSWNLRNINNNKGIEIPTLVSGFDYSRVFDVIDKELDSEKPNLVDTRIVSIGNEPISEEALSRRFVTLVITEMLVLDETKLAKLGKALEIKRCTDQIEQEGETTDPMPNLIGDINLQWSFGFLPKIANDKDEGNEFRRDLKRAISAIAALPKDSAEYKAKFVGATKDTLLFKLLYDNFNDTVRDKLFQCLADLMAVDDQRENESDFRKLLKNMISDQESKGYSEDEIADRIAEMMDEKYPSGEKSKLAGKKITSTQASQVEEWAKDLTTCMEITMFNELGRLSQSKINKYLVPKLQTMLGEKIANDSYLNANDAIRIFEIDNDFWAKMLEEKQLKFDYKNFHFDADTVQENIYGGTKKSFAKKSEKELAASGKNSLFGTTALVSDKMKTEAYKGTYAYGVFKKQLALRVWQTLLSGAKIHKDSAGAGNNNILKTISDEGIGDFINNFILDDIKQQYDALRKSNPINADIIKILFNNRGVKIS